MIKNELPKTDLLLSDFRYELPEELIAQTPVEPRDSSRLMVVDRCFEGVKHKVFTDIIDYLNPGDTLVVNETRVIPARIVGVRSLKAVGGNTEKDATGAPVELLLLRQTENDVWEALAGPGKRARPGDTLSFGDGVLSAQVLSVGDGGTRTVRFSACDRTDTVYSALHRLGTVPLPPYIREKLDDPERYQTVYAKTEGSAAAPTAGLHFTDNLLKRIEDKGVAVVRITLHVGLGTFRPVKEERIGDHVMHSEFISVSDDAARIINERRSVGGRTIAVGTTSCRTLESVADEGGMIVPYAGDTGIFIYPGYKFRATDVLITNFHLPESTLLMLVSAFAGREKILAAYEEAVRKKYRFFSFGDAMLIL